MPSASLSIGTSRISCGKCGARVLQTKARILVGPGAKVRIVEVGVVEVGTVELNFRANRTADAGG